MQLKTSDETDLKNLLISRRADTNLNYQFILQRDP